MGAAGVEDAVEDSPFFCPKENPPNAGFGAAGAAAGVSFDGSAGLAPNEKPPKGAAGVEEEAGAGASDAAGLPNEKPPKGVEVVGAALAPPDELAVEPPNAGAADEPNENPPEELDAGGAGAGAA